MSRRTTIKTHCGTLRTFAFRHRHRSAGKPQAEAPSCLDLEPKRGRIDLPYENPLVPGRTFLREIDLGVSRLLRKTLTRSTRFEFGPAKFAFWGARANVHGLSPAVFIAERTRCSESKARGVEQWGFIVARRDIELVFGPKKCMGFRLRFL